MESGRVQYFLRQEYNLKVQEQRIRELMDSVDSAMKRPHTGDADGSGSRGWADLPLHLLALIRRRVVSTSGDDARFSAVCTSWKGAADYGTPHRWDVPSSAHFYPALGQVRLFWGLGHSRSRLLDLPAPRCHCIGSSRGLLLCYDPSYRLFLFDPRAATSTPVPRLDFPDSLRLLLSVSGGVTYDCPSHGLGSDEFRCTREACPTGLLLSSAAPSDRVALCYYPLLRNFIYWRAGDDRWSPLPCQEPLTWPDAVYHRGRFYFVNNKTFKLFECDVGLSSATVRDVPIARSSIESVNAVIAGRSVMRAFLVECCGELLLVVWSVPETARPIDYIPFSAFDIFELRAGEGKEEAKWAEHGDIGRHALFLGCSESFSLSTRDFPGIEPNCIYLTKQSDMGGRCDRIVYRISWRSAEVTYVGGGDEVEPFWIPPRAREEA